MRKKNFAKLQMMSFTNQLVENKVQFINIILLFFLGPIITFRNVIYKLQKIDVDKSNNLAARTV